MANSVTFFLAVDPKSREIEYMSARVVLPDGREFHVGYHPNIGADGQRDGLNFGFNGTWSDGVFTESKDTNAIWLEDLHGDDLFCSEMFGSLTGKYPYEVRDSIKPNEDYAPFPA